MKHPIKHLLLFLVCCTHVWANGGGYHRGVDFTGAVAPFSPKGTEKVQIIDEKLDIVLKHKYAEVSVRYLMRNDGNWPAKVTFGFPVEDVVDDWMGYDSDQSNKKAKSHSDYCKNYQVTINGNPVKHKYLHEPFASGKIKPFAGSEQFKGIEGWMVSTMKVPAKKNIIVEIHYRSIYDRNFSYVSEDSISEPWTFKYRLSTGGVWKGPIQKGVVTVKIENVNPKHVRIVKPANRFKRNGDTWVWEFNNLEPTLADDILIHTRPGEQRYAYQGADNSSYADQYVIRDKQWFFDHYRYNVKASSELKPSKNISYSAKNVKYLWVDETYAWSEGKEGQGIGESITLTLKKPTKLYALAISNGYGKSDKLFAANSRVKDATLVINGNQKIKVRLYDHGDDQWISLKEVKGKVSSIQLIIDSVYPGSKFEDTCISSLSLVEKLKTKPKQYGCR